MTDIFSQKKRSEIMSKIKSKGTKIEIKMKDTLEENGIAFEYQPKLYGKPDFFISPRLVIFCDGSFWHGRDWKRLKTKLTSKYWLNHIQKNRLRDKHVKNELEKMGYKVLRFWDDEIDKNLPSCIEKITDTLKKDSNNS
jgi:DNA mismatch endonuclease (patch repair protein)